MTTTLLLLLHVLLILLCTTSSQQAVLQHTKEANQHPQEPLKEESNLDLELKLQPQNDTCSGKMFFLFMVRSSPRRSVQRSVIRKTWGSAKKLENYEARLLFVMGSEHKMNQRKKSMRSPKMDKGLLDNKVLAEFEQHGDIIQGAFIDHPLNNSMKHLIAFQWVKNHCGANNAPVLIVMTEDDVFVEVFHLYQFVQAIYGGHPGPKSLICDVVPSGTAPRRPDERWELYPGENGAVPDYCSGSAYMMTPDLLDPFLTIAASEISKGAMLTTATKQPDDVFVLGHLRQALGIHPLYLNPRFTYDELTVQKWLNSTNGLPLPYIFAALHFAANHEDAWTEVMTKLWAKTVAVHRLQGY